MLKFFVGEARNLDDAELDLMAESVGEHWLHAGLCPAEKGAFRYLTL